VTLLGFIILFSSWGCSCLHSQLSRSVLGSLYSEPSLRRLEAALFTLSFLAHIETLFYTGRDK
jgi:hypothetical protein